MTSDFFLSYRRSDRALAKRLVDAIVARGATIWWDEMIPGGVDWRDEIVEHLNSAQVMIILFSEDCNQSRQLRKELALADEMNKVVIPLLIEDTKPKGHFLYELASRNWLQIYSDPESKIDDVSEKLLEMVGFTAPGPVPHIEAAQPDASEIPAKLKRSQTQHFSSRPRHYRNFLPFKRIDLPVLLGAPLMIYLTLGVNRNSFALYEIIIGSLLYGTCIIAAYGAIVFPVRYFLRNLKLSQAARYYAMSASAIFAFEISLLCLFAIFEGRWANDMNILLIVSILASTVFGIMAFIIYYIMHLTRYVRIFNNHVKEV